MNCCCFSTYEHFCRIRAALGLKPLKDGSKQETGRDAASEHAAHQSVQRAAAAKTQAAELAARVQE